MQHTATRYYIEMDGWICLAFKASWFRCPLFLFLLRSSFFVLHSWLLKAHGFVLDGGLRDGGILRYVYNR